MNINKQDVRIFFRYVLPSIFSFALSGIYSIVDGYFIGNRLGDAGLSAVTIVYPIVAFIQAVGTGLGMGGAIYFSIERARGQDKEANRLIAIANWLMLGFSVLLTTLVLFYNAPMLKLWAQVGICYLWRRSTLSSFHSERVCRFSAQVSSHSSVIWAARLLR